MDATNLPTRPDLLLAGMVLPLLFAAGAALLIPVGVALALAAGAIPAAGTLGYALFYAPPRSA